METKEAKETWVRFALAAVQNYVMPDDEKWDNDDLSDDMAEVACKFADAMMDEYEERFDGGKPRRRKKKRAVEPEPDPEIEEEEEEEDDE